MSLKNIASPMLAAVSVATVLHLSEAGSAAAQTTDCTKPVQAFSGKFIVDRRDARAQAKVKGERTAAWSKTAAIECPGYDTSWARAHKKKFGRCGYFSSSNRYSCEVSAVPARLRR